MLATKSPLWMLYVLILLSSHLLPLVPCLDGFYLSPILLFTCLLLEFVPILVSSHQGSPHNSLSVVHHSFPPSRLQPIEVSSLDAIPSSGIDLFEDLSRCCSFVEFYSGDLGLICLSFHWRLWSNSWTGQSWHAGCVGGRWV